MDRGYAEFRLWNDIVAAGSSYVCRIRDNSNLSTIQEERPLSAAAQQAGVLRDLVVTLGASSKPAATRSVIGTSIVPSGFRRLLGNLPAFSARRTVST